MTVGDRKQIEVTYLLDLGSLGVLDDSYQGIGAILNTANVSAAVPFSAKLQLDVERDLMHFMIVSM